MATEILVELTNEGFEPQPAANIGLEGFETAQQIIDDMKRDPFERVVSDYALLEGAKIRVEVFNDGKRTSAAEWDSWAR